MTGRAERIAAVGYDYAAHEIEPVEACNLCGSTDLERSRNATVTATRRPSGCAGAAGSGSSRRG